MEENLKGFKMSQDTIAEYDDGVWKVVLRVTQSKTYDGENWVTKSTKIASYNEVFERAWGECLLTITSYLNSINGDLFSEQSDELIDEVVN